MTGNTVKHGLGEYLEKDSPPNPALRIITAALGAGTGYMFYLEHLLRIDQISSTWARGVFVFLAICIGGALGMWWQANDLRTYEKRVAKENAKRLKEM